MMCLYGVFSLSNVITFSSSGSNFSYKNTFINAWDTKKQLLFIVPNVNENPRYIAISSIFLLCLNEMLELREPPTTNLRSKYDTWKLVENRVPGPDFTMRSFKYCAPHLYNTLPKTIRQLDNIETFKKKLKTYIFSETFDLETKTVRDCFDT